MRDIPTTCAQPQDQPVPPSKRQCWRPLRGVRRSSTTPPSLSFLARRSARRGRPKHPLHPPSFSHQSPSVPLQPPSLPSNRRRSPPNRRQLPSNRRRLPSNRRRLPSNRRRLPSNRRRLPSNRRRLPSNHHRGSPPNGAGCRSEIWPSVWSPTVFCCPVQFGSALPPVAFPPTQMSRYDFDGDVRVGLLPVRQLPGPEHRALHGAAVQGQVQGHAHVHRQRHLEPERQHVEVPAVHRLRHQLPPAVRRRQVLQEAMYVAGRDMMGTDVFRWGRVGDGGWGGGCEGARHHETTITELLCPSSGKG